MIYRDTDFHGSAKNFYVLSAPVEICLKLGLEDHGSALETEGGLRNRQNDLKFVSCIRD